MTLFRFVLMSAEGTMFNVEAEDATFRGTRTQVLDMLNGDWSHYRDRTAYRYELSCPTNEIIVHVT